MKKNITIILMGIICFFVIFNSCLAGQFKVTKIYDGDTIMAEGHDITIYVLLAGIDAPELASRKQEQEQPYGQEAKRYLERLILNKIVEIKGYGLGAYPYNHIVGEIFVEDKNINIEMIKRGFAEVWREKPPDDFIMAPYFEAERGAKKAERGMWSLGASYISPQDWRNMHTTK
jgi:micrococcal nuclease